MGLEEDRQIAYSLKKISNCAELITQILTDNRETINLIIKDIKENFIEEDDEDDDDNPEFMDMSKPI